MLIAQRTAKLYLFLKEKKKERSFICVVLDTVAIWRDKEGLCISELMEAEHKVIWSNKPLPFSVYVAYLATFLHFTTTS